MNFFKTFKTYLNAEKHSEEIGKSSGSYEVILSDILNIMEEPNSEAFQDLVYEEEEHEEI